MQVNMLPFNISLLILKDQDVKNIRPVKVQDIFDGFSRNFHPDGLFSTETFGKVGEEKRNRLFSYIDIKIDILHPIIYKAICDLKALYQGIISGKEYAVFDKTTKDFIKSNPLEGETGYTFFLKHFKELVFEERASDKREFNIKMINKYRDDCFINKIVVMPAGLRDLVIDEAGKPSEDEINKLYRKVLAYSNILHNVNSQVNSDYLNTARYNIQLSVNEIFDYIKNMLEGKSKFIQGRWVSRKVYNSTANVITSYVPKLKSLNDDRLVSCNQTVVGLYQYLRATLPLSIKQIRDTYLNRIFPGPNTPAILVDKKTLKKTMVNVDPENYDEWMTFEGLEKTLARYGQENLRHDYLEIDNYYIGLIYKGNDNTFKFMQDIDELPEDRKDEVKNVYPITFTELLYISVFRDSKNIPCLVTRYPITGYGSVYPSYVYLKTTVISEIRKELDDNWELTDYKANEFPVYNENFYNSFSPSHTHLKRLGADFDGDRCNFTCLLTDESQEEIKKVLNSKNYYVGVNGQMNFSVNSEIIELVVASLTG